MCAQNCFILVQFQVHFSLNLFVYSHRGDTANTEIKVPYVEKPEVKSVLSLTLNAPYHTTKSHQSQTVPPLY